MVSDLAVCAFLKVPGIYNKIFVCSVALSIPSLRNTIPVLSKGRMGSFLAQSIDSLRQRDKPSDSAMLSRTTLQLFFLNKKDMYSTCKVPLPVWAHDSTLVSLLLN